MLGFVVPSAWFPAPPSSSAPLPLPSGPAPLALPRPLLSDPGSQSAFPSPPCPLPGSLLLRARPLFLLLGSVGPGSYPVLGRRVHSVLSRRVEPEAGSQKVPQWVVSLVGVGEAMAGL